MSDLKKLIDYDPKYIVAYRVMIQLIEGTHNAWTERKLRRDLLKIIKPEVKKHDKAKLNGTNIA